MPAGTLADDVLIATVAVRPRTVTITPPAGWTQLQSHQSTNTDAASTRMTTWWRRAATGETGPYTFTLSAGHTGVAGGIVGFSGVDTTTPIDVSGGNTTPSGFTHQANGVTTTVNGAMLVTAFAFSSATSNWYVPGGMTEDVDVTSIAPPSTGGMALEMAHELRATAGATAARVATAESAGTDAGYGVAHILALRPSAPLAVQTCVTASPSTCSNNAGAGWVAWSNSNLAHSSDNSYASATGSSNGAETNFLYCTGYGYNLPAGATIDSIEIGTERYSPSGSNRFTDGKVFLVKGGTVQWAVNAANPGNYPGSDSNSYDWHGGSPTYWTGTWSAADINAANFGAAMTAIQQTGGTREVRVDHMVTRVCYTAPIRPLADYRFDECSQYSGAAGEAQDTIGSYPGTPTGGLQNATPGQINRYADFSDARRFVEVPSGPALTDWTISVWFKKPFSNSSTHSSRYYVLGSVDVRGDFLFLDRNNSYRWGVYDHSGGQSNGTFQFGTLADGWHHMVLVGSGTTTLLYIDGSYRDQVPRKTQGAFRYLGASVDSRGTTNGQSFGTPLDEFKIFGMPLSAAQVTLLYNNELARNNWDGTARTAACGPIAEYRFDEGGWNGAAGEIIDSVGGNNGQAVSGATTVSGKLCNAGSFAANNSYALVNNVPAIRVGNSGADFSVTYWIRHANTFTGAWRSLIHKGSTDNERTFAMWMYPSSNQMHARISTTSNWNEGINTTSANLPLNTWTHVAYVSSGGILRVYLNGVLDSTQDYAGDSVSNNGPLYLGKDPWYPGFGGELDEFKIFDSALSATDIATGYANENAGNNWDGSARTCVSAFDHLRIEHAGSGVTCAPTTLTIKACADVTCSSLYSGGVTGTLTATGGPTANWVDGGATFAIGTLGYITEEVQVTTAGNVTWGATGLSVTPSNGVACYVGGTASCAFTSNTAGFLFDVPHHASDTSQTITVSAVKQADNSLACTPAFASTSKTINFGCGYSNPATGTLPVVVGGSNISCGSTSGISLTFNASGVASTTVRYADVGQMSLTASYTGSGGSESGLVMSGTDTFIAAPASFTVTPAGPYVAGSNFSVTVAAKNASGNTTPNFGKESTTENVTLGHTLTGPAGGNDPALSGTTTMPDASFQSGNGSATVSDIQWAEVGDIALTATLASASYLGSGLTANGSAAAGPFKPAYFDTVVTPGTGTFTYSGQPFAVQVTAKNAAGGTTLNYKGAYARIVTLSDGNSGTNNSATLGTFSNASIAAASFSNGVATTNTVSYRFNTKTTAPLETLTSAPLKLRAIDTDGVTSSGHTEGTTPLRAGRLRLVNFYGSDLLQPRIEYRAEYWDGSRWATNLLDSSNPIVAGNIATGGLTVNGVTALNNGIGFITFNTAAAGSYDIALDLNAVGVDTSCNAAHGGTAANKPWLQGYWSAPANCGGVAAWAQDPNARVRLGSPRAPYIYLRERY
ncbi:MAG: DUF6701 domain-containing protein [Pseudomonadota bacterium]